MSSLSLQLIRELKFCAVLSSALRSLNKLKSLTSEWRHVDENKSNLSRTVTLIVNIENPRSWFTDFCFLFQPKSDFSTRCSMEY